MKHIKLLLVLGSLPVFLSGCSTKTITLEGEVIEKEYTFSDTVNSFDIQNIKIKNGFKTLPVKVNFIASTENKLTITAQESFANYVRAETINQTFYISGKSDEQYKTNEIVIGVYGTAFENISVSYSNVTIDKDSLTNKNVAITANSASTVSLSNYQGDQLSTTLSGASSIKLQRVKTTMYNAVLSGASTVNCDLLYTQNEIIYVGSASTFNANGGSTSQSVYLSGASKYYGKDKETETTKVNIEGVSECIVNCTKTLSGTISGNSTLVYYGKPETVTVATSGGSTITRFE